MTNNKQQPTLTYQHRGYFIATVHSTVDAQYTWTITAIGHQ